ncbi:MAG: hypothetical protein QFB87_04185 [Patescibacteria group bacterium]|nr:hypothetical protein [Patescibacteria group bacterium]
MIKHDQNGSLNSLLVPLIVVTLFFVGSASFAAWAFASRQDYKTNTDEKIASAVTLARQNESTLKDKQFAEVEKNPLRAYTGPQAYGSLVIKFPKTWSAYVDDTGNGSSVVDGYFHPGAVPSLTSPSSTFALRVQVLSQSYTSVVTSFKGAEQLKKASVAPYALPLVPSVVGVRVDGAIKPNKTGSMIVLPLRDKTIEISTEGGEFGADFTNNILPNVSFSP